MGEKYFLSIYSPAYLPVPEYIEASPYRAFEISSNNTHA
jgi:hypothetical protein